jgi:hypothetical protein
VSAESGKAVHDGRIQQLVTRLLAELVQEAGADGIDGRNMLEVLEAETAKLERACYPDGLTTDGTAYPLRHQLARTA